MTLGVTFNAFVGSLALDSIESAAPKKFKNLYPENMIQLAQDHLES